MAGRGGWFKMYDDELEDPKIEQLTDSEYRVWGAVLKLCNRAPARLRERGYLYHSKGYPVAPEYIARRLAKPVEEVQAGLDKLLSVGGESSLLTLEEGEGGPVYRIRAWRKRQSGQDENTDNPEKIPESSQKTPNLSRPYVDVDVDKDVDVTEVAAVADTTGTPASVRPTWPAEMAALRAIDGYPFDEKKDSKLMDALAEAYPRIDMAEQIRRLRAWAMGKGILPLRGVRGPRQRVRNWIAGAEERAGRAQRPASGMGPGGAPTRRPAAAPAPAAEFTETGRIDL